MLSATGGRCPRYLRGGAAVRASGRAARFVIYGAGRDGDRAG